MYKKHVFSWEVVSSFKYIWYSIRMLSWKATGNFSCCNISHLIITQDCILHCLDIILHYCLTGKKSDAAALEWENVPPPPLQKKTLKHQFLH